METHHARRGVSHCECCGRNGAIFKLIGLRRPDTGGVTVESEDVSMLFFYEFAGLLLGSLNAHTPSVKRISGRTPGQIMAISGCSPCDTGRGMLSTTTIFDGLILCSMPAASTIHSEPSIRYRIRPSIAAPSSNRTVTTGPGYIWDCKTLPACKVGPSSRSHAIKATTLRSTASLFNAGHKPVACNR